MKKKSILFLLLMGLCLPWAANAQEQNMLNGNAADNGGRGTMRIYKKVSSLTSGKNYLIVSSQTANSNAYALSQTSSSLTSSPVHINAGDQFCSTVYINSEGLGSNAVWTANNGWTFSNSNYNIYAQRSGSFLSYSYSLTVSSSSSTNWTYSDNSLSFSASGGLFSGNTTYYITPSSNSFSLGTSSSSGKVYLYEETDLTVFDITATVSPSGIGTVTGTGRYLSGATCELTATSNNSEFAFTNWTTMNGTVVSTANPYTFTVRADQDLVANFESIVSCLAPTNLSVINESITAHTAALNWTENGEATQWQMVYSTDANFDPDGATPTLVSNNPYTITGLAQSTTYYAYVRAYCDATNQSAWSNQATFSTIAGNQPPTNLTLGTPEAHSITLSWTGVASNENHENYEVYYSTTNIVPSDDIASGYEVVNSNSCTLSGLTPETPYYAWVRDNCGTDGKSAWVAFNPFTTGIACFAPTNVTASNVTNNTAVISWTGEAESFNLRYGTIEGFSYGFEDAEPWNFTNFTPCTVYDGDGFGTGAISNVTFENQHYTGAFIAFQNGVEGASNANAHSGNAFGACFYATTAPNNDYFILPAITIESGYVFRFWAKSFGSSYLESFRAGVYNGNGNLTTVLGSNTNVPTAWTLYTYDLSSYAGQTIQLAINCNSNDKLAFFIDDIFVGNPNLVWSEPITGVTSPYTLTGLDSSTDYEVQVQGDCGSFDGLSQWSASASFQTIDNCTVPFSLNYTDATCIGATLSWEGVQESYNVQYRSVISPIVEGETTEGFEDATEFSEWQAFGNETTNTGSNRFGRLTGAAHSGSYGFSFSSYSSADDYNQYLISPLLDDNVYFIDFYYKSSSTYSSGELFKVGYSSTGRNVEDFTWSEEYSTKQTSWSHFEDNNVPEGTKYMAIHYYANYQYQLYIDDITFKSYSPGVYGPWVTESNVTSPLEITGLMPSTNYEWQVQGVDCDGNGGTTEWSEATTFNTLAAYVKHIDPYTTDGGYYLIASPVGQINPSEVNGMLDNDYDLYYFDQTKDMEWINYKAGEGSSNAGFDLVPGKGYLYANSGNNGEGVDLVFARTAYTGSGNVTLALETGTEFEGMNLVGNPFADTAYIADGRDFYRLADGGAEVMTEAFTGAIEPMEGVFVYANNDEENMTFTTTNPSRKSSRLILNLTNGNDVVDRAMVRFGEGRMLPKFQLNQNSTKVYMTVEGKDYAVVYSDDMGEMPVGFKAETNGSYTFNFSNEEVNLSYLHLIDNMTGNDVDLLAGTLTGSATYTFEAKTTDYENRFKLVYATGNNDSDDTFAFFSNGSFVINNEGEATLQVIDINGRILKSESINGCANVNVNAAQGIYMLRLVNGDNVKVQKVVVR